MNQTLAKLDEKKKLIVLLASKIKDSKTILIASTKNLPSSQFHKIKKNLRGKADIKVVKKSVIDRAISSIEKGALQNLKEQIGADTALFFSDIETFELSALLSDNQTPAKAKAGDIALEDVTIEAGPTDLVPGPAISELSSVGLKVAVEGGKISIKQGAVVAKKGEPIKENVANVLGKLNILPMKVGFVPIAAYDSLSGKFYVNIKIDKPAALEELKLSISKALGFALNIKYTTKETISRFITKAALEEKIIEKLIENKNNNQGAEEITND